MDPMMSIFEDENINVLAGDNISGESNTTGNVVTNPTPVEGTPVPEL